MNDSKKIRAFVVAIYCVFANSELLTFLDLSLRGATDFVATWQSRGSAIVQTLQKTHKFTLSFTIIIEFTFDLC